MGKHNGYPSWNAWNVSLWINNDESLYEWCRRMTLKLGPEQAAKYIAETMKGEKTPDGARYSFRSIYIALKNIQ